MIKKRYIASLLSGLVFPGAGQIFNREPLKGAAYIVVTVGLIIGVVGLVTVALFRAVGQWEGYGSLLVLWGHELARVEGGIILCLLGLFAAWVLSTIDAYIRGKERE